MIKICFTLKGQQQDVPGEGTSLTSKVLNLGMAATEKFAPLKKICQHVCAFHFYAHDMSRQVRGPSLPSAKAWLMCPQCRCVPLYLNGPPTIAGNAYLTSVNT